MRKHLKTLALAAWLGLPALALAAGMDCGKATAVVDKALCAVPGLTQRDAALNKAFERAKARAGVHAEGVVRNQRQWLTHRNDTALAPATKPEDVTKLYDERIAFLDHVWKTPDSPLLAAIVAKAVATPLAAEERGPTDVPWTTLGGDGSVFNRPKQAFDGSFKEAAAWMSARFAAGSALKQILSQVDTKYFAYVTVMTLDAAGVGGIGVWNNPSRNPGLNDDSDCKNWMLFGWKGRSIRMIDTPSILEGNCWDGTGFLVSFRGRVYAMYAGIGENSINIAVQPKTGSDWGDEDSLDLLDDRQLKAPTYYCALDDCGALIEQARKAIERYSRLGDKAGLSDGLSADEKVRFAAMRKLLDEKDDASMDKLPDFDGNILLPNNRFDDEAVYVPLRWHGELLLGRIGNALIRETGFGSTDWLLAVWRWDGKTFTPALGMQVIVQRGNLLLTVP